MPTHIFHHQSHQNIVSRRAKNNLNCLCLIYKYDEQLRKCINYFLIFLSISQITVCLWLTFLQWSIEPDLYVSNGVGTVGPRFTIDRKQLTQLFVLYSYKNYILLCINLPLLVSSGSNAHIAHTCINNKFSIKLAIKRIRFALYFWNERSMSTNVFNFAYVTCFLVICLFTTKTDIH